jgi:hypothetical protein
VPGPFIFIGPIELNRVTRCAGSSRTPRGTRQTARTWTPSALSGTRSRRPERPSRRTTLAAPVSPACPTEAHPDRRRLRQTPRRCAPARRTNACSTGHSARQYRRSQRSCQDILAPDAATVEASRCADPGRKRWTKSRAMSATSRQPLSMVSACPRFGTSVISVTPSLRFCFL